MSNYVLEGVGLKKVFKEAHSHIDVLKQIDLQISKKEFVAIVGSSGSGKSTLLHLLGGLDKPTEGKTFIDGKDLAKLSEREKCEMRNRCLGFVYQFHHLLPEFTAVENVSMPLLISKTSPAIAKEKSEHLLELVGLKKRLSHKTHQLSGGERQRVAIARALVTDPLCVLADEPTGNLDPQNAEKVFELFVNLQKSSQTSLVIVTHDMRIANRADRKMLLDNGKLVSV